MLRYIARRLALSVLTKDVKREELGSRLVHAVSFALLVFVLIVVAALLLS